MEEKHVSKTHDTHGCRMKGWEEEGKLMLERVKGNRKQRGEDKGIVIKEKQRNEKHVMCVK